MADLLLHEAVELSADLKIDEEQGIVYGVKVLGCNSKNKFTFPEATRRAAHSIMEGAVVNWDHRPKGATETALAARFGWLTGVREDTDANCTRADLHYLREHRHAKQFLSIVKQNPRLCGFSILGSAKPGGKDSEGRTIVSAITKVDSFDLVADPANTMGLREAVEAPIVPADPAAAKEEVVEEEVAADNDDYTAIGCMKAIMEIANGEGTDREKLEQIKTHVKQAMEMDGEGETEVSEEDAEKDEENTDDMKESVRAVRRKNCIELCEAHKVEPTAERLQLLVRIPKKGREGVIKKMALVKKPRSGVPSTALRETAAGKANPPAAPAETEEQINARLARAFKGY